MSRVGKQPIPIPDKVKVAVNDRHVAIEGPKGKLELDVESPIVVGVEEGRILVTRPNDARRNRSLHGLTRALVANMVHGVSEGFEKKLEIQGVGYRAAKQGKALNFQLGYSHPILFDIPQGIEIKVEKTHITVGGIDKRQVGFIAAAIREFRPPEPYKGKGVKYTEERIRRKVGKAAVGTTGG